MRKFSLVLSMLLVFACSTIQAQDCRNGPCLKATVQKVLPPYPALHSVSVPTPAPVIEIQTTTVTEEVSIVSKRPRLGQRVKSFFSRLCR